jgi:hypothetical protein
MKRHRFSILASLVVITLLAVPATAQAKRVSAHEVPIEPAGGWPPLYATSWPGTPYTLPFGADRTGEEVRAWALSLPAVHEAMAEAEAHGAVRRVESDAAYSMVGYSCAVIGYEYPGISIDSVQAIICIVTKIQPEDGRAVTNIFGGAYGKTVVNGNEVPTFRDDVPGAFQITVVWTQYSNATVPAGEQAVMMSGFGESVAVWWETSSQNSSYWVHAIRTDRSVATAFVNEILTTAGEGAFGGLILGVRGGSVAGALVGAGIGAVSGAAFAAIHFTNQPVPHPQMMMPIEPVLLQTGATKQAALGARHPSWGQLKAAYR